MRDSRVSSFKICAILKEVDLVEEKKESCLLESFAHYSDRFQVFLRNVVEGKT